MPAKDAVNPTAVPARIRLWLLDHPGGHSAADIATGLGCPAGMTRAQWVQKVSNALGRLARSGQVDRTRSSDAGMGPGVTYAIPAQTPATAGS